MNRAATLILLCGLLSSCQDPKKLADAPPPPAARVDRMTLSLSPPTVLNWDDKPGADGVRALMFFIQDGRDQPVTVNGSLDIMLYEISGNNASPNLSQAQPSYTWSLSPAELNLLGVKTIFGWGYAVQLGWGDRVPKSDKITIRARYRGPDGRDISPEPVTIPMVVK